jgi:NAD(P)-dependent dehydrogenase (short-subunit alcohol dehydrogenase family)
MSHPFDYSNKRVVITGAFSGVGAALLEVLAELGRPEVIALDIRKPDGPISSYIETNMGKASSVKTAADKIKGPIDVLFNNAGIAATHPVEDVMAVNWLGLRQLSEALLPKIREGGAIANTASIAGGSGPRISRRCSSASPSTAARSSSAGAASIRSSSATATPSRRNVSRSTR